MGKRIGRRQFLIESSRVALGASALSPIACTRDSRSAGGSTGTEYLSGLIADLEQQIPQLMDAVNVPGLAIAMASKTGKPISPWTTTPCSRRPRSASRCSPMPS